MKTLLRAFLILFVLTILTGILYPLAITGVAAVFLPLQSRGSLVIDNKKPVGSGLIGQNFIDSGNFRPRPSATNYSAMPSGGSNVNPISGSLRATVDSRRADFQKANGLTLKDTVPNDMLFASGSGLDPDISPEAARLQMRRISRVRHLTQEQQNELSELVEHAVIPPQAGFLGSPRVNVLMLNLALKGIGTHAP